MKRNRILGLFSLVLTVIVLSCLLVGITVDAAGPGETVAPAEEPSETTGQSESPVTPPPADSSGSVNVVGYELRCYDANRNVIHPTRITPGMNLDIEVEINDSRVPTLEPLPIPIAFLNTVSFVRSPQYPWNANLANQGDTVLPINVQAANFPDRVGISYVLVFPVQYAGKGNTFTFDLSYFDNNNLTMQQINITLNQCVEQVDSSSSSSSEIGDSSIVTRGTGFVLKEAGYGANQVTAGQAFQLTATMLSTNGSYNVENVSASLTLPPELTFASGTSTYYVGTVAPNQPIPIAFDLMPSADAKDGSYAITLSLQGVGAKSGEKVEAAVDISIPLIQPDRFEITNVVTPDILTANMNDGMGHASVSFTNKGKATVYNVAATVEGMGLTLEEGESYVGNMADGAKNSADFNILASEPGMIEAKVVVTYEIRGEEKMLTRNFTVNVSEGGDFDPSLSFPVDMEEPSGVPGWVWLLVVAGAALAAVVVIVIIRKKQKAKKAAQELEDDDDEDE